MPAPRVTGERLKLQTSYGDAPSWAKGYAAPEQRRGISPCARTAENADDLGQRFAVNYGEWTVNVLRGELGLARGIAEGLLSEAADGSAVAGYGSCPARHGD